MVTGYLAGFDGSIWGEWRIAAMTMNGVYNSSIKMRHGFISI